MFLPLMCTAKIICSLTLAPEGSDHRDQNTKEPGFLLPQADGRTGARPFQSPAVWGSRGSTELPNGEKKNEEVPGRCSPTAGMQGCRRWPIRLAGADGGRWVFTGWRRTGGLAAMSKGSSDVPQRCEAPGGYGFARRRPRVNRPAAEEQHRLRRR
jgi:hypothetical protein